MMIYKNINIYKILLFCFAAAVFCRFSLLQVNAGAQVSQKSHVHGVAQINIALERNELYIEFKTPAANLVGFEHAPKTKKEKAAVNRAAATLKSAETLFIISSKAGATLEKFNVESDMEGGHKHSHGHDDKHNHKEHEKETDQRQHSDFKAVYRFSCKNPDQLKYIDVMLFRLFKGIEKIHVQLLTPKKQTALQLTAKIIRINF